ncbi:glycosyl transferase group 1 [Ammonifex degensii KC4]|uniref:Glycosyl transferase group 1 n=1 Tax=Ammonifex degensii (strain DSM 10501 / KC4) TaxID=429009 RepID=C9RB57_AMMDK|nr:glycosyltransferase family 4 protein [Ammonifex degensii]ACX51484.1 glycosyl transferase group 1 [Ammonifex degensii KC4]
MRSCSVKKDGRFRILHVIRPAAGGMKRHLMELLRHTDYSLFAPAVAGPPGELLNEVASLGIPTYPLALKGELAPWEDVRAVFSLLSLLRRENFPLVHLHGFKAGLVGRLAGRLLRPSPLIVLTVHNSLFFGEGSRKQKFLARIEAFLGRRTFKIIAVSQALRAELLTKFRLPPDKVVVIPNGIDLTPFTLGVLSPTVHRELPLPTGVRLLGTVARLVPQKGLFCLLEALALLPAELRPGWLIVGDGPLRQELEDKARALGLSHLVSFAGYRPPEEIPSILKVIDIFVLPSLSEGLPLALLEAMAAGKPVVATAVGGIPEVVLEGRTGYLVPPGDAQALARALLSLLESPDKAREMGEAGRKWVEEHFSSRRMAQEVMKIYQEALATRG